MKIKFRNFPFQAYIINYFGDLFCANVDFKILLLSRKWKISCSEKYVSRIKGQINCKITVYS